MSNAEFLLRDLPDTVSAKRFLDQLAEKHPLQLVKLLKNDALLSDVLTLVSYSPLLATTLLQNPEYLWWLNRKRSDSGVRNKEELLEALARFELTNSQIEPHVLFARFRRRELMRIFLSDIRKLATIAEITEGISNLADAILENALRLARQELDNRYGQPLELDEKGRMKPAGFCVVALGKLGSRELNYSSDIDLLFLYSAEGTTSGTGTRGPLTNREYFIKLAESITKLVGQQTGEGAAYRVDLRLRPHGRVGPLALSVADTARYYLNEAGNWERQVLIRSRSVAGDPELFRAFFSQVENAVFSESITVETALNNVRMSKQKIDLEHRTNRGTDVKLGRGGIREIEFIAQALQLAYGGRDRWLRASHTLISLSRLADRGLLSDLELTQIFEAYEFLRRLEHILQMENGLQTHLVPNDPARRQLIGRRMNFGDPERFEAALQANTNNVNRIFQRIFGEASAMPASLRASSTNEVDPNQHNRTRIRQTLVRSGVPERTITAKTELLDRLTVTSPHFSQMLLANPQYIDQLRVIDEKVLNRDYSAELCGAAIEQTDFGGRLAALRKTWGRFMLEIVMLDVLEQPDIKRLKRAQTSLAEASIDCAVAIVKDELDRRYSTKIDAFPFAVLGLGKIGGAGLDYESDLDIVLVYDESVKLPVNETHAQFYARAAELFVTVLSSITRDGQLYRVDLRLRPYGKNGTSTISRTAFSDYMANTAAIWELLAYLKLRSVGGDRKLADDIEAEIREIIHRRAGDIGGSEIADATGKIRLRLEQEKTGKLRGRDVDIKFGAGGMLDVYFAVRFLQLRNGIPEDQADRSTNFMLKKLCDLQLLSDEHFTALHDAYSFLSLLDHNLRLVVGRSTRLPMANAAALEIIARRMGSPSSAEMIESLTIHRLQIRSAFEQILAENETVTAV